jgi:hypothetical protein
MTAIVSPMASEWESSWTPASLDKAELILIPGDIDFSNASIWRDRSGKNRHMLQPAGGSRPIPVANAINGRPGMRFDGATSFMSCVAQLLGTVGTIAAVVKANTLTSVARWILSVDCGFNFGIGVGINSSKFRTVGLFHDTNCASTVQPSVTLAEQWVATTGPGNTSLFVNNVAQTISSPTHQMQAGTALTVLGAYGSTAAQFWNGTICSIVVTSSVWDAPMRAQWADYCKKEYGI